MLEEQSASEYFSKHPEFLEFQETFSKIKEDDFLLGISEITPEGQSYCLVTVVDDDKRTLLRNELRHPQFQKNYNETLRDVKQIDLSDNDWDGVTRSVHDIVAAAGLIHSIFFRNEVIRRRREGRIDETNEIFNLYSSMAVMIMENHLRALYKHNSWNVIPQKFFVVLKESIGFNVVALSHASILSAYRSHSLRQM